MNRKPYDPIKSASTQRAYRQELLRPSEYNLLERWQILLPFVLLPSAVAAISTFLLDYRWIDILVLSMVIAANAALIIHSLALRKSVKHYNKISEMADVVPEVTRKSLKHNSIVALLSFIVPLIYLFLSVAVIITRRNSTEPMSLNWFSWYLLYFPIFATNHYAEISDIIFMTDGFYTGNVGSNMYFVPFYMIDDITYELRRKVKQGEVMSVKFFSNGEQFGHDKMYRDELDLLILLHRKQKESQSTPSDAV